jgi:hypothetical protein
MRAFLIRTIISGALVFTSLTLGSAEKVSENPSSVAFSGYVESTLSAEKNFDLNIDKEEDIVTNEPEFGFELLLTPDGRFRFLMETRLTRKRFVDSDEDEMDEDWALDIRQVYIDVAANDHFSFRLGRQSFKDEMEWLYDADLDGVRLFYQRDAFSVELSSV